MECPRCCQIIPPLPLPLPLPLLRHTVHPTNRTSYCGEISHGFCRCASSNTWGSASMNLNPSTSWVRDDRRVSLTSGLFRSDVHTVRYPYMYTLLCAFSLITVTVFLCPTYPLISFIVIIPFINPVVRPRCDPGPLREAGGAGTGQRASCGCWVQGTLPPPGGRLCRIRFRCVSLVLPVSILASEK